MSDAQRGKRVWIACATAHPYKFADVVEPVIGSKITPPAALEAIFGRTAHKQTIAPSLGALARELRKVFGAARANV